MISERSERKAEAGSPPSEASGVTGFRPLIRLTKSRSREADLTLLSKRKQVL